MLRPSASARRVLGVAVAVSVGAGIGFGAYTLGSSAGANSAPFPRAAMATTTSGPATTSGPEAASAPETPAPETPVSIPLTLEDAKAVAAQAAPGVVVEWDEDHEPTGLRYDVKLLHDDGSTTDVEVDTVTGQVTSINHDNDWD
jgi:hypothetical protein